MAVAAKIDDFTDRELLDELEYRNLLPEPDVDDIEDEDIVKAYNSRGLADDNEPDDREVVLLAEMIAAGDTTSALRELSDMFPGAFHIASIQQLVANRGQGRLFG